ncbi:MAG: hypothetical protein H6839_08680 [Planctomycetes bacterium]|nr:hypothetical protein [Planctomycetota bacterium]
MSHNTEPHEPELPRRENDSSEPAQGPEHGMPPPHDERANAGTAPSRKSLPTWAWLTVLVALAFFLWFMLHETLTVVPV